MTSQTLPAQPQTLWLSCLFPFTPTEKGIYQQKHAPCEGMSHFSFFLSFFLPSFFPSFLPFCLSSFPPSFVSSLLSFFLSPHLPARLEQTRRQHPLPLLGLAPQRGVAHRLQGGPGDASLHGALRPKPDQGCPGPERKMGYPGGKENTKREPPFWRCPWFDHFGGAPSLIKRQPRAPNDIRNFHSASLAPYFARIGRTSSPGAPGLSDQSEPGMSTRRVTGMVPPQEWAILRWFLEESLCSHTP